MANPKIKSLIVQTEAGWCGFDLVPGSQPMLGCDTFVFVAADGQSYTFGRVTPDPNLPAAGNALYVEMDSPGFTEKTEPTGIVDWIVAPGAGVTDKIVQPKWVGKPGDTPPVVPGFPGVFTEANRVDAA